MGVGETNPVARPQEANPSAPRTLELRRGEAPKSALAKLESVAQGFEAIFTGTLLSELMEPLEEGGGIAGSGPGASVIQGLLQTHLADHMSKAGGLGIGRMVVDSMKPLLAAEKVSAQELSAQLESSRRALPPALDARSLAPQDFVPQDFVKEEGR
jgi:Rod binding domain-containing protein